MSYLSATATAVPDHELTQEAVIELARETLHGKVPFLDQALALFRNAGVERRYLVCPPQELLSGRGFKWRNDLYIEECKKLGVRLLDDLLQAAGLEAGDIDVLITTSCTGFMIPALDSHLINHFRMRTDTRRLPFTELGCAAGAMAMSRAHDHLRAYPDHRVAVLAIEIPSMTYLQRDMSVANLVSAALFGDGGAAVLLDGREGPLEILHTRSHFFHDTPEMMGFDLTDDGFRIVLDKRVSDLVRERMPAVVGELLAGTGVSLAQVGTFLFHPGGRKILDSLEEVLELEPPDLRWSRRTLREVGNLSSATVLWVAATAIADAEPRSDGHVILGAFGPGFNAELLLGRWS